MNYLVVGLGNPGNKYVGTRHNVGFRVIDWLADEWQASDFTASSQAEAVTAEAMIAGEKTLLAKPHTFMNSSGEAIKALSAYFDIPVDHILVIYDDVDLALADIRLAIGRGSGGHRGVQSVISQLQTKDFFRLRVGISPTDAEGNIDKQTVPGKGINPFVMSRFASEELAKLESHYSEIAKAVTHWVTEGEEAAMNHIN